MPGEMAVPDDWNSIAFIILHLWRCSFQSDLVRAYDDAFLLFDPGTYLCKRSERRKAQEAVFSYSGIVLCSFRILSLDFRLLFSGKSVMSPSFWFDLLLTASLIGILPAARKAVST